MKKIFLVIVSLFCGLAGFAQLSLLDSLSNPLAKGDTVKVSGMTGYQISNKYYINNGGASSINTNMHVFPTKQYVSNCTYNICVGTNCYAPVGDSNSFQDPKSFSVPVGKYTNMLFTDYSPNHSGVTTILVVVYDQSVASDSTWIYVQFNATPTGIAPVYNNLHMSSLYPNPANNIVNFTYHTSYDAQLDIYNSLGQLVKTSMVSASKDVISLNVADMPAGIYICKLQASGAEAVLRRLIVSH